MRKVAYIGTELFECETGEPIYCPVNRENCEKHCVAIEILNCETFDLVTCRWNKRCAIGEIEH